MVVDWSGWPLLEVRAMQLRPDEAPTVVGAALAEAIGRGETFAAVVETPDRPKRVRGALEQVRVVRRLRPGMAQHCRGLAMVLQSVDATVLKAAPRIWGCPVRVVHDLAAARAWARDQLRQS